MSVLIDSMLMKEMKKELYKGEWAHCEEDDAMHVLPMEDILPHSTETSGDKRELAGFDCPCKPEIVTADRDGMYPKPMIIHKSFQDIAYLDEYLK